MAKPPAPPVQQAQPPAPGPPKPPAAKGAPGPPAPPAPPKAPPAPPAPPAPAAGGGGAPRMISFLSICFDYARFRCYSPMLNFFYSREKCVIGLNSGLFESGTQKRYFLLPCTLYFDNLLL